MKKILSLLLACLMVFPLAACGKGGGSSINSATKEEKSQYSKVSVDMAGYVNPASPLKESDELRDAMRKKVAEAKDEVEITGTTYYISNSGDDSNDGKSEKTPIKTISKLNEIYLAPGDGVRFKRGDVFRGKVKTYEGATYGAYGEGDKPCIYGPEENAAMGTWTETDKENIYVYEKTFSSYVGVIVFNHGEAYSRNVFDGFKYMKEDLDAYHDLSDAGKLYLRCEKGNPADVFYDIEIGTNGAIFPLKNNITIDNLCIKYAGGHAVNGPDIEGAAMTNCEIGWVGGCLQFGASSSVIYGNAFEVWGCAKNVTVKNCYMYQVLDSTVTFQFSGAHDHVVEINNLHFDENLIEYGNSGFEFWIGEGQCTGLIKDTSFNGNIIRFSGYGHGGNRYGSAAIIDTITGPHMPHNENFVIKNNIFDGSKYAHINVNESGDGTIPTLEGNTYIQRKNGIFGYWASKSKNGRIMFNDNIAETLKEMGIDLNPTVYFRDKIIAN